MRPFNDLYWICIGSDFWLSRIYKPYLRSNLHLPIGKQLKNLDIFFWRLPGRAVRVGGQFWCTITSQRIETFSFWTFFEHSSKANWTELVISRFQLWKIWRKKLNEKVLRNGLFSLAPSYNAVKAGAGILAMESPLEERQPESQIYIILLLTFFSSHFPYFFAFILAD